jgi:hypothetical protein
MHTGPTCQVNWSRCHDPSSSIRRAPSRATERTAARRTALQPSAARGPTVAAALARCGPNDGMSCRARPLWERPLPALTPDQRT